MNNSIANTVNTNIRKRSTTNLRRIKTYLFIQTPTQAEYLRKGYVY